MRKLFIVLTLAVGLAGCANIQKAYEVVTGASVSPQAVYIARNTFDALEATATNYISYCKVHPAFQYCSKEAIARVIPAVRSGRVARGNLTAFMKANPGKLGPSGLYNALISATNTIQLINDQYNMTGVPRS